MFGFGINVWYYLQNNLRTMRIPYELGFGALKLPLAVTDWHLIDNFRQVIIAISRWKGKFDTLLRALLLTHIWLFTLLCKNVCSNRHKMSHFSFLIQTVFLQPSNVLTSILRILDWRRESHCFYRVWNNPQSF